MKITLEDSRVVTASPTHPTADTRLLQDIRVGDLLDGSSDNNLLYNQ